MRSSAKIAMYKCANDIRKMWLVPIFLIAVNLLHAQTIDEWLKQEETQIKYLMEQNGALKAYSEVINKGYDIAQNGLTNIFTSKDGDYNQHSNYFLLLRKVKPAIKNYSKLLSIYKMKGAIDMQQHFAKSLATDWLNDKEKNYIKSVYFNLAEECDDLLTELSMFTSDDELQLKDDERIERIDKIYLEMQDRYEFSMSFNKQVKLLVINRLKEKKETEKLSSRY